MLTDFSPVGLQCFEEPSENGFKGLQKWAVGLVHVGQTKNQPKLRVCQQKWMMTTMVTMMMDDCYVSRSVRVWAPFHTQTIRA